jgi:acylphosphatase
MADEEMVPMHPWWRGFRGEIKQTAKNKYDVVGVVKRLSNTSVEITELPIHKWTQNYKVELESMIAGKENEEGTIKVRGCRGVAVPNLIRSRRCRNTRSITTQRTCTLS